MDNEKDPLQIIDHIIMDEISKTGDVRDRMLSHMWGYPRTAILDELQMLQDRGYVHLDKGCFALTELGQQYKVPLNHLRAQAKNPLTEAKPFDWLAPYAPERGWRNV